MNDPAPNDKTLIPRFWFCVVFTVPFLLRSLDPWLQWLLGSAVVGVGTRPFFQEVLAKRISRFTLICLSLFIAYIYSVLELLLSRAPTLYFDKIASVIVIVLVGLLLEKQVLESASVPLRLLLKLAPKKVIKLFADGHEEEVAIETLAKGDSVRIRPNEVIAVDGVVFSGRGFVNESLLSADANPVEKVFGDMVTSGTRNLQESFIVQATHVGRDSTLAKILEIVAPLNLQNVIHKLGPSPVFLIVVAVLSFFSFFVWALLSSLALAIGVACTVLVSASPHAFTLASILVTLEAQLIGATRGIVIRSSDTLELIQRIDTLVFGKTSILTSGQASVVAIGLAEGVKQEELLAVAAGLEVTSQHPIGQCIIEKAKLAAFEPLQVEEIEQVAGLGLKGKVNEKEVLIGDEKFMEGIELGSLKTEAKEYRKRGYVVVFCAKEKKLLGILAILDPLRKGVKFAIESLKKVGLQLFCLSSDRRITVVQVANALMLDRFQAEASLKHKFEALVKLKKEGRHVALFGDPVKNASLFRQVDVGITRGPGPDLSKVEAAVILLKSDLRAVVRLFDLVRNAYRLSNQNLFIAYAYNIVILPVAAFGGVSFLIGASLMVLSTLLVAVNSLRLRSSSRIDSY